MKRLEIGHEALALALYLAAAAPDDEREAEAASRANKLSRRLSADEIQKGVLLAIELIADDPHQLMAASKNRKEEE